DTTFRNCYRGIYISTTGKGNAVVERCTFVDCRQGLAMSFSMSSGTFAFRDNTFDANDAGGSIGMVLTYRTNWAPVIENNVLSNLDTGYIINGRWGQSQTVSLGNLTVSDCARGLVSEYNIQLTLHNSSFTNIGSSLETFIARNSSTITIIDTIHPWGSGTVEHANSWIKAYMDLEVRGAKWKDGGPIGEGDLVLENVTQFEVARYNLSDIQSQDIAGWEVTSAGRRTSLFLYPAMYFGGHGFRGDRIDLRTYTPSIIELIDDYAPVITVEEPEVDSGYATDTIVAKGAYDEKGSGLDMIEYSLDGGPLTPLTSWSDGNWNLPLTSLVDGEHTLVLVPTDKVGNKGDQVSATFLVDTVLPLIELDPYGHLVNTTTIVIIGRTEVHATLEVNSVPVDVDDNGNFTVELDLTEGSNHFNLATTDRAGNSDDMDLMVVRDTIIPDLVVLTPEDDLWTNARSTMVEGTTEDEADVQVNGEQVEVINGTFRKRVDLIESDFTISVTATDMAGNMAEKARILHVDWTAPDLVIVEPEEPEVYVRESTIYISGDVDDPTVDHVMVNDQSIPLTSGRFVKQFTVLEGTTEFVVTVVDAAFNGNSAKVVVIRDLTPPSYESEMTALGGELLYVDGDHYCTAPAVEVHLMLTEVSHISLEDGTKLPTGTEVRHRFELVEGINALEIYIAD
ncbi:MAG: right-handed parallel beta-helix repeat-containing protein, partial [Thermoplasmata archaeon]|nr:right-handed parallel beta-helix repeat-containing protein [Thermoplasmata archaeon]